MIRKVIFYFLAMLIFISCASIVTMTGSVQNTSTAVVIPTTTKDIPEIPLVTAVETPVKVKTTPTQADIGSKTASNLNNEKNCLLKDLKSLSFSGMMFFSNKEEKQLLEFDGRDIKKALYSINLEDPYLLLGFSPDSQWFAMLQYKAPKENESLSESQIILISHTGEVKQKTLDLSTFSKELPDYWVIKGFTSGYWLNKDFIYFDVIAFENPCSTCRPFLSAVLVNPFDGSITSSFNHLPMAYEDSIIAFSPDYKRVLYNGESGISLRSVPEIQQIFFDRDSAADFMQWSSDSNLVVYLTPSDLESNTHIKILDQNGVIRLDQEANIPTRQIYGLTLSPGNNKVLFLVNSNLGGEIVVFDTKEQTIAQQCVLQKTFYPGNQPVWSYDGQFMAITIGDENDILIFDIEENIVFTTKLKGIPIGWLASQEFGK